MPPKSREIPYLEDGLLDALIQLPIPLQVSFIRQHCKIAQAKLAERLKIRQAYLSKLEKIGMDHLLSNYEKIAEAMGCRLAIVPRSARIVPREK